MSRITPPVTKVNHAIRTMSSSASRSAHIVDNSRNVGIYLPRKLSDLRAECNRRQLQANGSEVELIDRLTSHDFHTLRSHNPSTTQPIKTIPLMQGFHTSPPKQAVRDSSTIDHFIFPTLPAAPPTNPFEKLRVPLLPDNYTPDRSASSPHAIETLDTAVAAPEILIVASHPDQVVPAAMSEVVGNEGLDVDIGQLTRGFSGLEEAVQEVEGGLKELWSGFVDDVFGTAEKKTAKVVV